jgi:hypothetical protein
LLTAIKHEQEQWHTDGRSHYPNRELGRRDNGASKGIGQDQQATTE